MLGVVIRMIQPDPHPDWVFLDPYRLGPALVYEDPNDVRVTT